MPLGEVLVIALGTSVAKFLVKQLLPGDGADAIAADVVDAGVGWLTARQPADPVGEAIGRRVAVVYNRSRLPENEKQAVAREAALALAAADTGLTHLIAINLDAGVLQRELVNARPEAARELSADGQALYGQMLRVAAEGIVATSDQLNGYLPTALGQLLYRQSSQGARLQGVADDLTGVYEGLARWLREPEEKARAFEEKYRNHLSEKLDRMEPFGIPKPDATARKLRLRHAFVGLRVRYRSNQPLYRALVGGNRGSVSPDAAWTVLARVMQQEMSDLALSPVAHPLAGRTDDPRVRALFDALVALPDDAPLPDAGSILRRGAALPSSMTRGDPLFAHLHASPQEEAFENTFAGERRIMLEGKAGTGKSSLLQWLAVMAAQGNFPDSMAEWNGLVPFFIRLRSCPNRELPAPEVWPALEAKPIAGTMPDGWVHDQLERGQALVLIDGVDEMPQAQRPALLRELQALVQAYPLARYVVSSRPTTVNEQQWPEWREWLREKAFAEVTLQEMDRPQRELFVDRWHEAYALYAESSGDHEAVEATWRNAAALKRMLRRREELRKLAQTPLLAAMICTLYQERREHIPRERLKLYQECVQMLLERREQGKGVDLSADYIVLSESQMIALLRALAYWMLDNELTSAPRTEVEERFAERLPRLDGPAADSAGRALRLFVERVELLQEEVVGEINFRHRTFQEYLAADSANFESNIRALVKRSGDDQWRETIILAFGLANRKDQGVLLRGILDRARKLKADGRRQRLLLALACLETGVDVDPALRQEVVDAAQEVFPPHSAEEAQLIARAGAAAVDLLPYDPDCPVKIAAHAVAALAAIGGEEALAVMAGYVIPEEYDVLRPIAESWDSFDHQEFADTVLARATRWPFSGLPTHPHWVDQLGHVKELGFDVKAGDDLSPLAGLLGLTGLGLRVSGEGGVDLSPLAGLSGLTLLVLYLPGGGTVDLSPLAGLSGLASLEMSLSGGGTVDLSPLAGLSGLTSLEMSLSGGGSVDLGPPAGLSGLTSLTLDVSDVGTVDLGSLAGLSGLTSLTLTLRDTKRVDLEPLAGLSRLTSLVLDLHPWDHEPVDLEPLAKLRGLTSLRLNLSGGIVDLSPLAGLSGLTSLRLDSWRGAGGDLTLLSELSQLTALELHVGGIGAKGLSWLAGLSQLTSLKLWLQATVASLAPLSALKQLRSLELRASVNADLSPLAELSGLTSLWLVPPAGRAAELGPLAGLTGLTWLALDVSSSEAVDLSPLAGLPGLTALALDVSGKGGVDLSPLAGLTELTALWLVGDVADLSPLAGLPRLTALMVPEGQTERLLALLRPLPRPRGLAIFEYNNLIIGGRPERELFEQISRKTTYLPARRGAAAGSG